MASGSDGNVAEARARWARSAKELLGKVVGGKYRVEEILGRGGMGTIYVAEQQPLGRKVALKVLHSNLGDSGGDPEFQKRFLLEAATLSQLAHPNIVVVHDYGSLEEDEAACFMAMELLDGRTISDVLRAEGTFDAARALSITREIARALRAAHGLGVIHRDLKPGNVMLCRSAEGEQVKVLDFGLVKVLRDDSEELTAEGRFLGSPRYMSPEQIQRLPMDGRSDLYALGVILYRMLSGDVPFAGDHAVQTLMAHLQHPVPRIEDKTSVWVPPAVEQMVYKLLEKEPEKRYASAQALIDAIDRVWPQLSNEPLVHSGEMLRPDGVHGPDAPRSASEVDERTPPSLSGPVPVAPHAPSSMTNQGPVAMPPASDGERAGPRWPMLVLVGVVVAAAVAGGLLLAMSMMDDDASIATATPEGAPTAPEPPAVVEPSAPDTPAAPPVAADPTAAARTFQLTIESEPAGATILRDGERIGVAPVTLEMDPDALESDPATFTLRLPRRAPYVFTQGPSDEDVTVVGRLARRPRPEAPGREPRGGNPRGQGGAGASIKTQR